MSSLPPPPALVRRIVDLLIASEAEELLEVRQVDGVIDAPPEAFRILIATGVLREADGRLVAPDRGLLDAVRAEVKRRYEQALVDAAYGPDGMTPPDAFPRTRTVVPDEPVGDLPF